MQFNVNEFLVIFIALCLSGIALTGIIVKFVALSREQKIVKVKEWLKYAVTMAEKEFGAKTGQLKLAYVYNLFVDKFPSVVNIVSLELFSAMVDESLKWLDKQLESNDNVKQIVEGE